MREILYIFKRIFITACDVCVRVVIIIIKSTRCNCVIKKFVLFYALGFVRVLCYSCLEKHNKRG